MESPIKIYIADDHPIFRCGLRDTIEKTDQFHILGEADQGTEALHDILRLMGSTPKFGDFYF